MFLINDDIDDSWFEVQKFAMANVFVVETVKDLFK